MNSLRLKGTHGAMKSGMLAAETLMKELDTTEKVPLIMQSTFISEIIGSRHHGRLSEEVREQLVV